VRTEKLLSANILPRGAVLRPTDDGNASLGRDFLYVAFPNTFRSATMRSALR
jgi:hypothetical protein